MLQQSFVFILLVLSSVVQAQVLINGQIFTGGLAIIDAPAPDTTLHTGATQSIAIDVSGDGHLDAASSTPGSGLPNSFNSLEVYLISPDQKLNLTVSQGTGLLTQEPGSTVKHINWAIDNCIPSGNYNLTFYETSLIQSQAYFIITPLPVAIENVNPTSSCKNGTNTLQSLPQDQSPPAHSPWLTGNETAIDFPSTSGASPLFHIRSLRISALVFAVFGMLLTL